MILIKPRKFTIETIDGEELEFTIHRLPATVGREIAYQYLSANLPAVGKYEVSKQLRDKLMSYVTVQINDTQVALTSDELIDNHCRDWETADKVEDEMLKYNTSFLADGKGSIFSILCQAAVKAWLTPISMESSASSSGKDSQP